MMKSFDGGFIDVSSIRFLINKLQLYIENEEKIIENIKKSLILLESDYCNDNTKILLDKKNNLFDSLNTVLNNKKKYKGYLKYVLDKYIELDNNVVEKFNSSIN